MPGHLGEVIETSSTYFVAQCYSLGQAPPLGSLVKTASDELDIYGVVSYAATLPIDPGRRPLARGRDLSSPAQLLQENPQLPLLFRTDFRATVVGFKQGEDIQRVLPPVPAPIHGFVYLCAPAEVSRFTAALAFLPLLLGPGEVPPEEVVAACLRRAAPHHPDPNAFLVGAGKQLALSLRADPMRLEAILMRMRL